MNVNRLTRRIRRVSSTIMHLGICIKREFWSVTNTFFEKMIHKFTWVSGVDNRKSLLDLAVVQEENRNKLLYVNIFRGAGGGISDHH